MYDFSKNENRVVPISYKAKEMSRHGDKQVVISLDLSEDIQDLKRRDIIKSAHPKKCYILNEYLLEGLTGEELSSIDKQLMDLLVKVRIQLRKKLNPKVGKYLTSQMNEKEKEKFFVRWVYDFMGSMGSHEDGDQYVREMSMAVFGDDRSEKMEMLLE